jgi:hypothetical protein
MRWIRPEPSTNIPKGIVRRIISTGSFPNRIAASPDDSTLAVADYAANRMLYYSFLKGPNAACTQYGSDPSNTTFFFATAGSYNPGNGGPDGIHYDVHGNLWAACGIGGIIEYDPRGFIVGYVPLPNGDPSATNFSFGGENNQYIYMEGAVSGTVYKFKAPYPGLIGPGGVRNPGLTGPGGVRMTAQHCFCHATAAALVHLIHRIAAIRKSAWYKRLESHRDRNPMPLVTPGQGLP